MRANITITPMTERYRLIHYASDKPDMVFGTEEEARVELLKHICSACLAGGEWEGFDENGITQGIINIEQPPNQNDIQELLGTPCGCEWGLEEPEDC